MTSSGDRLDDGRLTVSHDYVWLLHRNRLDTFESFYDESLVGKPLRVVGRRANLRFTLAGDAGRKLGVFMKRHEPTGFPEKIASWLRFRRPRTAARAEWENIRRLAGIGIATAAPVALGEDPATGRSFLATAELERAVPADDFARARFASDDADAVAARRRFARDLGELVRRLHSARLTHRDLYLCHVFVRESAGDFLLHLIDLQRVERCVLRRWRVKDLAQIEFSRPPGTFTRTDGLRFLHACFAADRLDAEQKGLAAAALRKAGRMRRRERPKDARR